MTRIVPKKTRGYGVAQPMSVKLLKTPIPGPQVAVVPTRGQGAGESVAAVEKAQAADKQRTAEEKKAARRKLMMAYAAQE